MPRFNARLIPAASIAVALAVLGLKLLAWQVTGSVALFSDALESVVNVVTALVAFSAIRIAQRPADRTAPYGYHKAEYFSAVVVGVMIVVAAILIAREAIAALFDPVLPEAPLVGVAISAGATLVNAAWAVVLLRAGRAALSPALEADGKHLLTDVLSTVGVIVGLVLVSVTGVALIDPILALLVAANILWSGFGVVRQSIAGLMDVAVPEAMQKEIRRTIAEAATGAIEAHDIRARQAGRVTFVDFHLVVPGEMDVKSAHDICDVIEDRLRALLNEAQITIHVEPDAKAKHSGIVVL